MHEKRLRHSATSTLAAVLTATMLAAIIGCGTHTASSSTPSPVAAALNELVRSGLPGAQTVISRPDGEQTHSAGTADLDSGAPYRDGSHIRIGSVTKTFVATVVLQLAAQGTVQLDNPIGHYLPNMVSGNGNDGDRITVRQLLQHTSGLPDFAPEDVTHKLPQQLDQTSDGTAYRDLTAADEVGIAMTMPPRFEPGARFEYTNTNYVLLGILVEHLTGHRLDAEIRSRILDPLALRDTYFPALGDTGLRDPHPHGYRNIDGTWVDVTTMDAAWAGAAGAMISTGSDLNRFATALMTGKLLPPAQLAQMQQTMPMTPGTGMNYGLGLISFQVPCGTGEKQVWGHTGGIPGFGTVLIATSTGTAATISVNTEQLNTQFSTAITTIICSVA